MLWRDNASLVIYTHGMLFMVCRSTNMNVYEGFKYFLLSHLYLYKQGQGPLNCTKLYSGMGYLLLGLLQ